MVLSINYYGSIVNLYLIHVLFLQTSEVYEFGKQPKEILKSWVVNLSYALLIWGLAGRLAIIVQEIPTW